MSIPITAAYGARLGLVRNPKLRHRLLDIFAGKDESPKVVEGASWAFGPNWKEYFEHIHKNIRPETMAWPITGFTSHLLAIVGAIRLYRLCRAAFGEAAFPCRIPQRFTARLSGEQTKRVVLAAKKTHRLHYERLLTEGIIPDVPTDDHEGEYTYGYLGDLYQSPDGGRISDLIMAVFDVTEDEDGKRALIEACKAVENNK